VGARAPTQSRIKQITRISFFLQLLCIANLTQTSQNDLSGVKQVTVSYTTGNGTWFNVTMSNLVGYQYNGTIPQFAYGTTITYVLIAEDWAGNTITTQQMGYDYQYQVIPEFPSPLIVLILMATTLAAIIAARKRRYHVKTSRA